MNALNNIIFKLCEGIRCNECSFNEFDGVPGCLLAGCLLAERIENLVSGEPELVNSLTEVDRKNDDLIRRQDAIDAADRADYLGFTVEDVKKVTDEVVKELKTLPSAERKTGKWIPCSEGYPEMDERVLVNLDGRYDIHVWDCMSNRGDSYFWEDEAGLFRNKYEVLYWMRIPELSGSE